MRSAIKAALSLSVGSTALILSGVAFGQGDTGVGDINFGGSPITGCEVPGATSCRILAEGTGFIQRQLAVGDKTFIQTVIDDAKGFKSEDFVRLGSGTTNEPGISSKLDITPASGTVGDTFGTGSTIKSGWASSVGPNVTEAKITLNIARIGDAATNKADDFSSDFLVATNYDKTTGKNTISNLRIDQTAYLGSIDQKQVFATQIKAATADSGGALKFATDPGTGTSWTAGQMIQATYVGQAVNVGTVTSPALANFSSETVSNIQDPAVPTSTFASNLNVATPTYWTTGGPPALTNEFTPLPTFIP